MFLSILFFPFLGFIYSGLFGKFFGREGSSFLQHFLFFVLFIVGFRLYEIGLSSTVTTVTLFSWAILDIYTINFGLLFDALSCGMLIIVTGISSLVHLYSVGYMSHDPHISRLWAIYPFFTFFMLVLVTADNFIQLFVGWEGVGYVLSY